MHACNRPNSISRVLQHSIQCVHKTTKSHGALYTSIKAWQAACFIVLLLIFAVLRYAGRIFDLTSFILYACSQVVSLGTAFSPRLFVLFFSSFDSFRCIVGCLVLLVSLFYCFGRLILYFVCTFLLLAACFIGLLVIFAFLFYAGRIPVLTSFFILYACS